jgi:mRNA interferase HigB
MHVISKSALRVFWEEHADAKGPLESWFKLTEQAAWHNLADVRRSFNSADVVGVYTVFNVKGNDIRVITAIHYNRQKVYIRHVFTHPEYNRWNKK